MIVKDRHFKGLLLKHYPYFRSEITVTPILGILVAIGSGLALVAVAIILVLRFRPGRVNGSAHRRHKQRTYLSAPHLPLDQQHRDVPDECIDLEEKDPDVIPVNKGKVAWIRVGKSSAITLRIFRIITDVIEEEEAFQAYAEQRRYASTLGRNCVGSASTRRREAERENMKGFKGNISRFVSVSSISHVNVFRYLRSAYHFIQFS